MSDGGHRAVSFGFTDCTVQAEYNSEIPPESTAEQERTGYDADNESESPSTKATSSEDEEKENEERDKEMKDKKRNRATTPQRMTEGGANPKRAKMTAGGPSSEGSNEGESGVDTAGNSVADSCYTARVRMTLHSQNHWIIRELKMSLLIRLHRIQVGPGTNA